jgi:predicted transcriptional regulator
MLYGPPEIKQLLLEASATATNNSFPSLTPTHYSTNGEPVYNTKELAESLGIPEEEVQKILAEKEQAHGAALLTPHTTDETIH